MAKQAFDSAKRGVIFSFDPDEVVLIVDPKHPLYDVRIELPLKAGFVENVAARGVITPIVVRKIDGKPIVIDGRQRVKAAREANVRRRAEGLEPIQISAIDRKGGAGDAYGVTVSANEFRTDDEMREKVRKAQHAYNVLGRSPEDIAIDFGVGENTVKKWLDTEETAVKPRKARGPSKAPSVKVVRLALQTEGYIASDVARAALKWAVGDMTEADFLAFIAPPLFEDPPTVELTASAGERYANSQAKASGL
jgi:ParB family chromosome partitioning protein